MFVRIQVRGLTGQDRKDVRELEQSHHPVRRIERVSCHDTGDERAFLLNARSFDAVVSALTLNMDLLMGGQSSRACRNRRTIFSSFHSTVGTQRRFRHELEDGRVR